VSDSRAGLPPFFITIDAEGDDLWAKPQRITASNASFLPRFQGLCEAYGLRPTYLTNYELASSVVFQEFGRDVLSRGAAEIGMHLHAWNSPPLEPLTRDDHAFQPYLAEYPERLVREKVRYLTGLLEDTFGVKLVSHRAGRWHLDETYARVLVEHGYLVDCSVTPQISWRRTLGDPAAAGGSDYSLFRDRAYFLDLEDLSREGSSPLLEVPLTVLSRRRSLARMLPARARDLPLVQRALAGLAPVRKLTPKRDNLKDLTAIAADALRSGRGHLELAIHSSELMPGGSPSFPGSTDIERLYESLGALFEFSQGRTRGATLAEYRAEVSLPSP